VDAFVDAFGVKASTLNLSVLGARMKAAREAIGLSQIEFNEKFGHGSARTYQKNEAGSNEAGIVLAESFARAGINVNWLMTGEGEMFLDQGAPAGGDQGAAVYNREKGIAQSQAQYQTTPEPVISRIDGPLLRLCWGACSAVHGEPFSAANQFQQLEHAVDFYNQLLRAAAPGGQTSLEEFARLDIGDLASQLRIYLKMGRAKPFHPHPGR